MVFPTADHDVPQLDTEEMIEVDRAMIEDYDIALIQMMENAGRNLAHLARMRFCDGDARRRKVLVLAGGGGNGGGALVAARRLSNWGSEVFVALGQAPESMTPIPKKQLSIVKGMVTAGAEAPADTIKLSSVGNHDPFDLIIDGLIGYSLRGAPSGLAAELIAFSNAYPAPILSLDAPSGIDTTSGRVCDPAIVAAATLTLALPKKGLFGASASRHVGELYLADISVPPELYNNPPLSKTVGPLFCRDDILRIL